jgi:hypothetical protein
LRILKQLCKQGGKEVFTQVNINNTVYLQDYKSSPEMCTQFLNVFENYDEVYRLDIESIFQDDFNVNLYAVVVIYNKVTTHTNTSYMFDL